MSTPQAARLAVFLVSEGFVARPSLSGVSGALTLYPTHETAMRTGLAPDRGFVFSDTEIAVSSAIAWLHGWQTHRKCTAEPAAGSGLAEAQASAWHGKADALEGLLAAERKARVGLEFEKAVLLVALHEAQTRERDAWDTRRVDEERELMVCEREEGDA